MLRTPRTIIAARVLADLTQKDLAEAAGIALSVLQAIEQGSADPKNSTVIAIIDALAGKGVRILPEEDGIVTGVVLTRLPLGPTKRGRRGPRTTDLLKT
jgi:predicted transcriptional regulator